MRKTQGTGPNPSGICLCGCGEKTAICTHGDSKRGYVFGKPMAYVAGHQIKKMQSMNIRTGVSKTPEWKAWWSARERCANPEHRQYPDYGGRGIQFLFDDFESFLSEAGPRPSPKHSIDRLNNDGHYEVGNLAWRTRRQQQRNTRKTSLDENKVREIRTLSSKGMTGNNLAKKFGVSPGLISAVIHRTKWSDVA